MKTVFRARTRAQVLARFARSDSKRFSWASNEHAMHDKTRIRTTTQATAQSGKTKADQFVPKRKPTKQYIKFKSRRFGFIRFRFTPQRKRTWKDRLATAEWDDRVATDREVVSVATWWYHHSATNESKKGRTA